MHMMGKIAVWLVVLAAIASTLFTAKLIQVRNSWTKKSNSFRDQYQALQPKIADQTLQVAALQAELFRAQDLWGRTFKSVPTQMGRPGELIIGLGQNDLINPKEYLYGFEILPDGTSVYRGDFTVEVAQNVQAQLRPNWVVRPEDIQTWQPGNWRWRTMIPPGYQPVYDAQTQAILRLDDVLADRREKLKRENALEMEQIDQLKLREAELVGGDQLSKDPDSNIEFRLGLVAAVEEAEESRNQLLRKVDELRRRVRVVQQGVDKRSAENRDLIRKLPQSPTAVGAK